MKLTELGEFQFAIAAKDLDAALKRISVITSYSASPDKQYLFVSDGRRLYIVGLAQEITAYVCLTGKVDGQGAFSFPLEVMSGLIKRRAGTFLFSATHKSLEIRQKDAKFNNTLNGQVITKEVMEAVNTIDVRSENSVDLSEGVLGNLRKFIKVASLKDAVFNQPLPVYIRQRKGILSVVSYDNYHVVMCRSKERVENDDFKLAVTGTVYNVIEKFIASSTVKFSVEKYLKLVGGDRSFFASIPPIQAKDEDYATAPDYYKATRAKPTSAAFRIDGRAFKVVENMGALRAVDVDAAATKYTFKVVPGEGELQVTYTTAGGTSSESMPIQAIDGEKLGKATFVVSNKILENIVLPMTSYESVDVYLYPNVVILEADTKSHRLIAMGSLDA